MPLTRSLQEVVLAIHFAEPLSIAVPELASWIAEFGGVEPAFQQLPALPTANIPVPGAPSPFGVQFLTEDAGGLPRVRVHGSDGHTLYIFQNDRIGFGWQRNAEIGQEVDYPGYDALRGVWAMEIERFINWLSRLSQSFVPRLVELSYNNNFPLIVAGRQRRISEIFKLLNPDYRPVNAFQASWSEYVGSSVEGMVTAQVGLGMAPPGQRVLAVNYFGLCAITDGRPPSVEVVMKGADKLHERILDMHRSAVISNT